MIGINPGYRAVDPIFQVLRTVPPLAWLPFSSGVSTIQSSAIFCNFYYSNLANHYQHYGGVQQIPRIGNVSKCCDSGRSFFKILIPSAVPHLYGFEDWDWLVLAIVALRC